MANKLYRYDWPKDPNYASEFYPVLDALTVRRNLRKGDTVELTEEQAAQLSHYISLTEVADPGNPPPIPAQPSASQSLGLDWFENAGHSLAAGGGARVTPHGGYHYRLKSALGSTHIFDYAMGGAIACRPTAVATGDGGYGWLLRQVIRPGMVGQPPAAAPYNPASQIVNCHFALNDLAMLGATKPEPFKSALRTILAHFCAAAVFEVEPSGGSSPQWAFTGTWADLGIGDNVASTSGAGLRYSATIGDKATFTTPADFPGSRVVGIGLFLNSSYKTITYGIKINGVAMPDLVIDVPAMTDQSVANMHLNYCLRIGTGLPGNPYGSPLPPGQNTIEITYKAAGATGGGALCPDRAHIEADPLDGPLLICPLPNKPATYGIWATWPGAASMNDGAIDSWKTYVRDVLAEFPGRVISDDKGLGLDIDNAGYNRYTASPGTAPPPAGTVADFISDGAHWSETGHAKVAEYILRFVRNSPLITDRIRTRPSVDPKPRGWKKVGQVNASGGMNTGWSNYANAALPDFQWRIDDNRRVFVRGTLKAAVGALAGLILNSTLPKPAQSSSKVGNTFDGVSTWSQRRLLISNAAQISVGGTINTGAGNILEFDFDYQAEV